MDQNILSKKEKKRLYDQQRYAEKRDAILAQCKAYREANPEKNRDRVKRWRDNNRERAYNYDKNYREANSEKISERKASWRLENTKKIKESNKTWRKDNPDKVKAYNKNSASILRRRLYDAVRGKAKVGSAVRDLGCSIEFFKEYIASKFTKGMTWDNHGEWHLDHIIPLSSFDLTNREQFIKAAHYTNLQPLWKLDNLKKGSRY